MSYQGKSTGALEKDYFLLDNREVCENMTHFLCDAWGCGSHFVTEGGGIKITNSPQFTWDFPTFST